MKNNVEITCSEIKIDGKAVQIISGAIHYFRIHPEQWSDRLQKAVQIGLNCVETYFCWNLHEPVPGEFDFSGILDFERFIKTAEDLGLYVIVRPGPYICAEWTNGGIPPWLLNVPGCRLRRANVPYLAAVKRWFDVLLPKLRQMQYTNGGPIIMAAVENEYGSFGRDSEYVKSLHKMYLEHGFDIPLVTADGGGNNYYLLGGSIPDLPVTLTFDCGDVLGYFAGKRMLFPDGPDFCMEYWLGAFDHWGAPHHTIDIENAAKKLDMMLQVGASVNIYMFIGGTNFGFTSGANMGTAPFGDDYLPHTTSYDYDAPLNEAGDPTPKYFALQRVIRKYRREASLKQVPVTKKITFPPVRLTESAVLSEHLDELSEMRKTSDTEPMEAFGQNQGFILYRTILRGPVGDPPVDIKIYGLRDRAQLWCDGTYLGTAYRNDKTISFPVKVPAEGSRLDVLVENMGHINYGPFFGKDLKGIIDGITIGYQYQNDYECFPLPLNDLSKLTFSKTAVMKSDCPVFYRGEFELKETADTFLTFPGEKGVIWINGFNLGRYWNIGPGNTLYVPAPVLKVGFNEIIVFELHKLNSLQVEFVDHPLWNAGTKHENL
jgi:beta-galactosidase